MPESDLANGIIAPSLEQECEIMRRSAKEAGALALSFFTKDPKVWEKGDRSPVTEADLAVDQLLRTRLSESFTGYGWLSEETDDDPIRLASTHLFIVDPIDGTRNFMRGGDQWTISMALAIHGVPHIGVVYNPVRNELLFAKRGKGASCNEETLRITSPDNISAMRVAGPSYLQAKRNIEDAVKVNGPKISPLAYRIASIATGNIDGAVATKNAHDWDIAASDVILSEAGGLLTDLDGNVPRYGKAVPKHPELVASHAEIAPEFRARVRNLI